MPVRREPESDEEGLERESSSITDLRPRKRRAASVGADSVRSASEVPTGVDSGESGDERRDSDGDDEEEEEETYEDEAPLSSEDDPDGLSALPETVMAEDNLTVERAISELGISKFSLLDDATEAPYVTHTDLARIVGRRGRQLFADFPTLRLKRVTDRQARDLVDRHILSHLILRGHRVVVVPLANAHRLMTIHRKRLAEERALRESIAAASIPRVRSTPVSGIDPSRGAQAFNARLLEMRKRQPSFADRHTNTYHVPLASLPHVPDHKPGKYPLALLPGQYQEAYPLVSYADIKILEAVIAARKTATSSATTATAASTGAATPSATAPAAAASPVNPYAALAQEISGRASQSAAPILCSYMISSTQQCQALVAEVGDYCRQHRPIQRATIPCTVRTNNGPCGRPSGRFAVGRCDAHFNGASFLCGETTDDGSATCAVRVSLAGDRCPAHKPKPLRCFRCEREFPASEVITCARCGRQGDLKCWELKDALLAKVKRYNWECYDCKRCVGCNTAEDEAHLLICDTCDRGFHTYCHNPRLTRPPSGTWSCQHCFAALLKQTR